MKGLVCIFLIAFAVEIAGWPFHRIWGAFIALLGIVVVVLGWKFPALLWGLQKEQDSVDPVTLSRAGRSQAVFGAAVFAGGIAYAFTSRMDFLMGAVILAVIYQRTAPSRARDGEDHDQPAA